MERLDLPSHLRGVFFDWAWGTTKVRSLPTPTTHLSLRDLTWHLDLTVWTTEGRAKIRPCASNCADGSGAPQSPLGEDSGSGPFVST